MTNQPDNLLRERERKREYNYELKNNNKKTLGGATLFLR